MIRFKQFLNEISKKTLKSYLEKTEKESKELEEYPNSKKFRGRIGGQSLAKRKLKDYKRQPKAKVKAT